MRSIVSRGTMLKQAALRIILDMAFMNEHTMLNPQHERWSCDETRDAATLPGPETSGLSEYFPGGSGPNINLTRMLPL